MVPCLAERALQKIVLQRQLADLGVQRLQVEHRLGGGRLAPKHVGGTGLQLLLPVSDLVGVKIELLRPLGQCPVAAHRGRVGTTGLLLIDAPVLPNDVLVLGS